jgi:metal-responsive CopG/Arc/MetJ family transcriptional regulator
MENLTIQLAPPVVAELNRLSKVEGMSRSALAEKALRYYLFESEFAEIHPRMVQHAKERGIINEDDVFRRVS